MTFWPSEVAIIVFIVKKLSALIVCHKQREVSSREWKSEEPTFSQESSLCSKDSQSALVHYSYYSYKQTELENSLRTACRQTGSNTPNSFVRVKFQLNASVHNHCSCGEISTAQPSKGLRTRRLRGRRATDLTHGSDSSYLVIKKGRDDIKQQLTYLTVWE